ncbi:hypothetical protein BJ165DRAFT_1478991 [Panaeolus papilionaceus]|nr:hypothetical protein BJ165DRAFT_1478991 [Panaeolus papilionaceus]
MPQIARHTVQSSDLFPPLTCCHRASARETCHFKQAAGLQTVSLQLNNHRSSTLWFRCTAMSTTHSYSRIRINGRLSVMTTTPEELRGQNIRLVILMGATGAGKSAFVETLSPGKSLGISKDTIYSVTQNAILYKIQNLQHWDDQVIIMDTPGFLDPGMSESRIVALIRQQFESVYKNANGVVTSILYFHPISEVRLAHSRGQAIDLLRAVTASLKSLTINFVTSMWNNVATAKMEQTNRRLEDLKFELFKRAKKLHINVTKFECTMESSLFILENAWVAWNVNDNLAESVDAEYKSLVRTGLLERIAEAQSVLEELAKDKIQAVESQDHQLLMAVNQKGQRTISTLEGFLVDLHAIDPEAHKDALSKFPVIFRP